VGEGEPAVPRLLALTNHVGRTLFGFSLQSGRSQAIDRFKRKLDTLGELTRTNLWAADSAQHTDHSI
jgi:hypothetical protein